MKSRTSALVAITGLFLAGTVHAAEFRAALGGWRYNLTGTADDGNTVYDFERDLAIRPDGRGTLKLEWDTPKGWWPDLALNYSHMGASGKRTDPGAPPVTPARTLEAKSNFYDYDFTARYPLRWGDLKASLGVSVKRLVGNIYINDSSQLQPSQQRFDQIFPQLQLNLRCPLMRGLELAVQGQGIKSGNEKAWEYGVSLELRGFEPLLVEVGWQEKHYDVSTNNYVLDATLRGLLLRFGVLIPG